MDPTIIAIFGYPEDGLDINASFIVSNDASVIAMFCLAFIAIVLRFTARFLQHGQPGLDDWTIVVSLIFVAGTSSLSIAGGAYGAGKHIWAIGVSDLVNIYKILYVYTFIYASACSSTKISLLLFYQRIFKSDQISFRLSVWFGYFLSISYPLIVWITMGNCCHPITFYWEQFTGATGQCINVKQFFLALGIINMLSDMCILIIPIAPILHLQMSSRKKFAVAGIMLLGGFVCVASIVRIWYLSVFMNATDVTWLMGPVFIWSAIEPSIAIVSACLPHYGPLARIARLKMSSHSHSNSSRSHPNSRNPPWRSGSRPTDAQYTYGGSRYRYENEQNKSATEDDDEIGLTNRVTAGGSITIGDDRDHASKESTHGPGGKLGGIVVQSTFVRATTKRKWHGSV